MLVALLGVVFSLTLFAPSARADALDDAKAAGVVGEKLNGYLGVVSRGAGADVQRLVQDINLKRRDRYRKIAQATPGSTLSDVEVLAGAQDYLADAGWPVCSKRVWRVGPKIAYLSADSPLWLRGFLGRKFILLCGISAHRVCLLDGPKAPNFTEAECMK